MDSSVHDRAVLARAVLDRAVLDRAVAGDQQAFDQLTRPYLRELHVHCYRLLGSLTGADDLVQETLLAAWRSLPTYAGRASVRAWLYRIATNRFLTAVRDAGRRPSMAPVPPFDPPEPTRCTETTWLQPYPDARLDQPADATDPAARRETLETVELAFVAALQQLPPRQAAALILVDVAGFSATETADLLGVGGTAVKGLLQRARAAAPLRRRADGHRPSGGGGSGAELALARRFAVALVAGDIDEIVGLLTDDAWLAMPPAPHQYGGPAAIGHFLRAGAQWRGVGRLVLVPTRANRQPAFGYLIGPDQDGTAHPAGILVLTMQEDRISRITLALGDDLAGPFDLSARRPADRDDVGTARTPPRSTRRTRA